MKKTGEDIINVLDTFVKNTESLKGIHSVLGNENQDCTMDNVLQHLGKPLEGIDGSALGLVLRARANLSRLMFMDTLLDNVGSDISILNNDIRSAKELDGSLNTLQNSLLKQGQTINSEDFLYIMKNVHLDYLKGIIGKIGDQFKLTFAQAQEIFETDEKRILTSINGGTYYFLKDPFAYQCTDKILYLLQKGNLDSLQPKDLNDLVATCQNHIENKIRDSDRRCGFDYILASSLATLFLFTFMMAVSNVSYLGVAISICLFGSFAVIIGCLSKYDYDNYKLGEYKLKDFNNSLPVDHELEKVSPVVGSFNAVTPTELCGNKSEEKPLHEGGVSNKLVGVKVGTCSQGGGRI